MRLTVKSQLILSAALPITLFIVALLIILFSNNSVTNRAVQINQNDFPSAVISLNLIDEIADMNSNVLEYILGESDEKVDFQDNYKEFIRYLGLLQELSTTQEQAMTISDVESLGTNYSKYANLIFTTFNPDTEKLVQDRVDELVRKQGAQLEKILDTSKEAEVYDAGHTTDLQEALNDDLPGVQYYLELIDEAGDMLSHLTRYVGGKVESKDAFDKDAESFEFYLSKLTPLEQKPAELVTLSKVETLFNFIKQEAEDIFKTYNPQNKKDAIALADKIEHEYFSELEKILDVLATKEQKDANDEVNLLIDSMGTIKIMMLIFIILVIGLSALLNTYITKNLTSQLGCEPAEMVDITKRIAKGDFTVEFDKPIKVGVYLALFQMSKTIKKIARQIIDSSMALRSFSTEIDASSQTVSTGASEQAASVEEVSASIEEMQAIIGQTKDNALTTQNIATKATEGIRNGNVSAMNAVKAMHNIKEKISLITGIAEKTDLLAVNAAIEAARAGEYGKGFAVVASDVRKLSEQSQKSAIQIDDITIETLSAAESSSAILTEIVPDMEKTLQLVLEISTASTEQSTGINQISNAIQQLTGISSTNASSAEELAASSTELMNKANELNEIISFFKVDDDLDKYMKKESNKANKEFNELTDEENSKGKNIDMGDSSDKDFENF